VWREMSPIAEGDSPGASGTGAAPLHINLNTSTKLDETLRDELAKRHTDGVCTGEFKTTAADGEGPGSVTRLYDHLEIQRKSYHGFGLDGNNNLKKALRRRARL
jgi:hypothetical protein